MALSKQERGDFALQRRLESFFQQARPLFCQQQDDSTPDAKVVYDRLSRFIENARAPLEAVYAAHCANPWLTARLGNDEVRVSSVLASLWDRDRHGDEARAFLARFLASAGDGFPDADDLANGYRVQTEHCLNGSSADRVDITVETRTAIIGIEVKIYAAEGEKQLERYVSTIKSRAELTRRETHKVIFLAPYTPKGNAEGTVAITWQMLSVIADQANKSIPAGWLISQFGEYCHSLGG